MTEKDTYNEIRKIKKLISDLEKRITGIEEPVYDPKKIYIMFTAVSEDSYMLIGMDKELKSVYGWMSLSTTEEYDNTIFYPSGEAAIKSLYDDGGCILRSFDNRIEALLYMTQLNK